jgi:serine/threonine protein kinase
LGRDVAIKVMPDAFAADPERLARFERESRAAAALAHQNVLAIYDVGRHDGRSYLVTELFDGTSLREYRDEAGALPLDRVSALGVQIRRGLHAAHGKGIVHRDLKPENGAPCTRWPPASARSGAPATPIRSRRCFATSPLR